MTGKKKNFFNKKKKITSIPWEIEPKTAVLVNNHLTSSAKFIFEILLFSLRTSLEEAVRIKTY